MRSIVLDTETTGLDLYEDRIISIGCVELYDSIPTGNNLFLLVDPEINIPEESTKIHGISNEDVRGKPTFKEVYSQVLEFLDIDDIYAHNASFDKGILKSAMNRIGLEEVQNKWIDTLTLANKLFPRSPNSLQALCRRFGISVKERKYHGALIDAELLAKVLYYLKQISQEDFLSLLREDNFIPSDIEFLYREEMVFTLEEELNNHKKLIEEIGIINWPLKGN